MHSDTIERSEEIECIEAMYPTEIQEIRYTKDTDTAIIVINCVPTSLPESDCFVSASLELELPVGYPTSAAASIKRGKLRGINDEHSQMMQSYLSSIISERASEGSCVLLEAISYVLEVLEDINDKGDCSICLEPLSSNSRTGIIKASCWHAFHTKCLARWCSYIQSSQALRNEGDSVLDKEIANLNREKQKHEERLEQLSRDTLQLSLDRKSYQHMLKNSTATSDLTVALQTAAADVCNKDESDAFVTRVLGKLQENDEEEELTLDFINMQLQSCVNERKHVAATTNELRHKLSTLEESLAKRLVCQENERQRVKLQDAQEYKCPICRTIIHNLKREIRIIPQSSKTLSPDEINRREQKIIKSWSTDTRNSIKKIQKYHAEVLERQTRNGGIN